MVFNSTMGFDVSKNTIYLAKHGSHAYGTNTPSSDLDVKGICIEPIEYHFGFLNNFEQQIRSPSEINPHDEVIYSLKKFAKLATDNNPNILECLFVDESDILFCNKYGVRLREFRKHFLSRKAKHTFSGYAHAQLKKIKSHRSWLLNPPSTPPSRKEFGLSNDTKVTKAELGAFEAAVQQGIDVDISPKMLKIFIREKQYASVKQHWDQYQNWLKTRNPTRSINEAKYGYDTKHSYHLIRLMKMCVEILRDGEVIVKRPDAQELLNIRNGSLTYDELIAYADSLEKKSESLYETSPLPREPNRKLIDDMIVGLTTSYMKENGSL